MLITLPLAVWMGFLAGKSKLGAPSAARLNEESPAGAAEPTVRNSRREHHRFRWSDVETDDLQRYISNLRSMGCPESVISDIIRARVFADYQSRVNKIFNPLARYWSPTAEMKAVDLQIAAIRQERDQVLESLGVYGSIADTLNGLPPEKARYISEAAKLYPKQLPGPDGNSEEWQEALANRKLRIDYLSRFLSPDELLTYRVTQDGNAVGIGFILRDINPSDDEFRRVFSALDGENLNRNNGVLAPELEAKLSQALGDDRYGEYRNQLSPENFFFNTFVSSMDLSPEGIAELKELRSTAETIDPKEYREAVASILPNRGYVEIYFSNPLIYRGKPRQ